MARLSTASSWLWYGTTDPGISEPGVELGNWWMNTNTGILFSCANPAAGAQSWFKYPNAGIANLTTHGLLVGSGSSSFDSLGEGSTGTVLTGLTGNNPVFTATPTVTSITFGSGNALSAYTEQTSFAPTIIGSTGAGVGTYSIQQGYYTKIGNMVFVTIEIVWSAHTGTGDLWIGNLPFTIRNSANYSPEGIVNTQNMTLPGGANRTAVGSAVAGQTYMIAVVPVSGGANSPLQMQTSGNIRATLAYLT